MVLHLRDMAVCAASAAPGVSTGPVPRTPRGGGASPARPARDTGFTAPSRTAAAPAGLLQLEKGDAIQHRTFGRGMVLSVRPVGNDALVEVAFDGVGTKKLMLKVAGAHITKL